jgi:hypothetical protein
MPDPSAQSPLDALPQGQQAEQAGPQQSAPAASGGGLRMTPVSSSTVHMVGHDPRANELHVIFKSDPNLTYVHSGVDEGMFQNFLKAKSKGLFYANTLKGKTKQFPFKKVKATPPQL